MSVRCEAPWTLFQLRFNGSIDFNRDWADYKNGFGDLNSEFWLGNDKIHQLTSRGPHSFQFVFYYGIERRLSNSTYGSFQVANEADQYRLHVDQFIGGNGGNAFMFISDPYNLHNNKQFSTRDKDNDVHAQGGSCGQLFNSGFWFASCWRINPNGLYRPDKQCDSSIAYKCIANEEVGTEPVLGTELKIRWN